MCNIISSYVVKVVANIGTIYYIRFRNYKEQQSQLVQASKERDALLSSNISSNLDSFWAKIEKLKGKDMENI